MTYKDALKEARKVGASKATGDALLAQTCEVLSHVHAIVPELVYNGARFKGLTGIQVSKLGGLDLGDLMFHGDGL